ncbi:MAG: hypothetical protein ACR2LU_10545 [Luteitalea sp.]
MSRVLSPLLLLLALCCTHTVGSAQAPPGNSPPSDLDTLMERVLGNRDQSWRQLQEYLLTEREIFRVQAPDGSRLYGMEREYLWLARDGRAVRSPVRINGVAIAADDRAREEARWSRDQTADDSKQAQQSSADRRDGTPRFISEVQFLRFPFEPGNYYLSGREILAGRPVIRIEYYPTRLFGNDKRVDGEHQFEAAFNKVSLVTLWVDPAAFQVVRYTFDNVDFNFLPARSLVRVDTAQATMTMGQPFEGVWLPSSLTVHGAVTLATGTYRAEYERRFGDYRRADVQMRFRVKDDK